MASKATGRKPMFGNRRSHALNATRHVQKLNLQNVTLADGTKVKVSTREAKRYKKDIIEIGKIIDDPNRKDFLCKFRL